MTMFSSLATDRQTDGQIDRQIQGHSIYRASIASRGKSISDSHTVKPEAKYFVL